ncbi:Hca operon transcriptional activator HcaR [Cupriavidus yeoncheonensis]|uniref:Hca operon transcriptional activator HcaR n=1 Tax=Cupriavidus yeoncheonensis TaxID=1462994 RepID=A0A916IY49_9BURK|nr:LysR family transcriptional regulator [Cupriavidus yeoncheonensis]CAG2153818.1 Hca operon transcriptional activator HcaR [Cupriavidus yeoncheonensis]
MELRHLRYFLAAAEEEHFGRASERLHVTRPAVSQIISDLESEIGTALFERYAQRVRLTAAGRNFLQKVTAVMNDLNEAVVTTKRVGDGKSGTLNIGYGSLTLIHSIFRVAIKRFRDSYPDVALSLVELPTADQPKALAEGKIHAGFMHLGPNTQVLRRKSTNRVLGGQDRTVLDWICIQKGKLGAVVPNDHRLANRKSVRLAELSGERFVVVPRGISSPLHPPISSLFQEAGFEPQIVQEVSTSVSQLNLISVGMGIGLSVVGKNFSYPPDLTTLPLSDVSYATTFVLGWIKGERNPALDHMIEIVEGLSKQP